jgi:hypothetical protein
LTGAPFFTYITVVDFFGLFSPRSIWIETMFLDEKQVDTNVNWLLERASPPVVYLTHKNILKTDSQSKEMANLWTQVENYPPARDIFSKQQPDGSWCAGGAWAPKPSYKLQEGYEPTTPKYVTAAWILPILGDMGFDKRDQRVRRACNYALTYQWPNGYFASSHGYMARHKKSKTGEIPNTPCHFSLYLLAFAKVGMGTDPLLKKSFDLLTEWQREDGGWVDERHKDGTAAPYKIWDRSCPWSTYHALSALYYSGDPDYREAVERGLKFLIGHLASKDEVDICQMFYHGHTPVRELLMFTDTGVGLSAPPVQALLEWLKTFYQPSKGFFKYKGKPISKYSAKKDGVSPRVMKYRLYHLVEDDWFTYYLTRIGKNILKQSEVLSETSAEF